MNTLIVLLTLIVSSAAHANDCANLVDVTASAQLRAKFESADLDRFAGNHLHLDLLRGDAVGRVHLARFADEVPFVIKDRQLSHGAGRSTKIITRLGPRHGGILDFDVDPRTHVPYVLTDEHLLRIDLNKGGVEVLDLPVKDVGVTKIRWTATDLFAADRRGRLLRVHEDFKHFDVVLHAWGEIKDFAVVDSLALVLTDEDQARGRTRHALGLFDLARVAGGRPILANVDVGFVAHALDVGDDSVLVATDHGIVAFGLATVEGTDVATLRPQPILLGELGRANVLALARHGREIHAVEHDAGAEDGGEVRVYTLRDLEDAERPWLNPTPWLPSLITPADPAAPRTSPRR